MKASLTFLSLALSIAFFSCEKGETLKSATLTGKWKLFDSFYSIGGPLIYKQADSTSPVFLDFKNDGRLSYTNTNYIGFAVKDTNIVTFTDENKDRTDFYYFIKGDTLTLSPAGPRMCIEGCGERFIKVD